MKKLKIIEMTVGHYRPPNGGTQHSVYVLGENDEVYKRVKDGWTSLGNPTTEPKPEVKDDKEPW